MIIVQSCAAAVFLYFVTMLCWGSWANTQRLAAQRRSVRADRPKFSWEHPSFSITPATKEELDS